MRKKISKAFQDMVYSVSSISVSIVLILIAVYFYWKLFGRTEFIKIALGSIIGAGLIIPILTIFHRWKIKGS